MNPVEAAEGNLRWLLRSIQHVLDDPDLTDLHIRGPGSALVDCGRGMMPLDLPYSLDDLEDIAINAAALTGQDIAADVPIVSTRFPDGERVQIQRPPAVAEGRISFSIRKPKQQTWRPEQLDYANPEWLGLLTRAVQHQRNIVFCGKVGSGKTHAMRAFTHAIPPGRRIVTIEDTPELINLPISNVESLYYSKGGQSVARTTAEDLVDAALRMGPDGILMQELRDEAAYAYLSALESGHWGMTTTHADSAQEARHRVKGLVKRHAVGRALNDNDVTESLRRSIHVVVHCVREGNRRYIEQVLCQPSHSDAAPVPSLIAAE